MQRPKNWQIELWVVKRGILCYAHFLLSQSFSPLRSIGSYWQGSLLLLLKSAVKDSSYSFHHENSVQLFAKVKPAL